MVRRGMTRNVWHKRYHGDALNGYMGLTLEQRGAYTTILDLLYDSDWAIGIPDRERWIAGHLNVSTRRWKGLRDELMAAGKLDLVDGLISNFRYRKERENAASLSRKRSESGASGGRNSGEVRRKPNENNGGGEASASNLPLYARATDTDTEADKREVGKPTSPAEVVLAKPQADPFGPIGEATSRLARAAGVNVSPNHKRFPDQLDIVRHWMTLGLDLDTELIPALEQASLNDTTDRFSLKKYDPLIGKLAAAKDAKRNGRAPASRSQGINERAARAFLADHGESLDGPDAGGQEGLRDRVDALPHARIGSGDGRGRQEGMAPRRLPRA